MAESLNFYLTELSKAYYLKSDSREAAQITFSYNSLKEKIKSHFGSKVNRVFEFGSWDRDTILPRKYDEQSDIDIMIVFNHSEFERTPETYRNWLLSFAQNTYPRSNVYKSSPTVTIELNHIKYDLVPAKEETGLFSKTLYIPESSNSWISSDPLDVKTNLTNANTRYNGVVRPIIRLLKAWNCFNNYPYNSYNLELEISGLNFSGDNVATGLFYAVEKLDPYIGSTFRQQKVKMLQNNIQKVKNSLRDSNHTNAMHWLHKVLP